MASRMQLIIQPYGWTDISALFQGPRPSFSLSITSRFIRLFELAQQQSPDF